MTSLENKQLMMQVFSELSKGNLPAFFEVMHEEMEWTWMGSGPLSRTFKGKSSVVNDLWGSVKTSLTQPFKVVAHRFTADGDYVIVESTGNNATPDGRLYNNKYCWVCRLAEGKLRSIHEYMDTELVTKTFM